MRIGNPHIDAVPFHILMTSATERHNKAQCPQISNEVGTADGSKPCHSVCTFRQLGPCAKCARLFPVSGAGVLGARRSILQGPLEAPAERPPAFFLPPRLLEYQGSRHSTTRYPRASIRPTPLLRGCSCSALGLSASSPTKPVGSMHKGCLQF